MATLRIPQAIPSPLTARAARPVMGKMAQPPAKPGGWATVEDVCVDLGSADVAVAGAFGNGTRGTDVTSRRR